MMNPTADTIWYKVNHECGHKVEYEVPLTLSLRLIYDEYKKREDEPCEVCIVKIFADSMEE